MKFAALVMFALTAAHGAAPAAISPIDQAFAAMYRFDFPATHSILDRYQAANPSDPLGYMTRGAAYLFSELHRLGALEAEFVVSNSRINQKAPALPPDPAVKAKLTEALRRAREAARARLATQSSDANALFTMALSAGIETDWAALVEKRQLGSLKYAKESQAWAVRLLKAHPDFHDAYLTMGISEYLVGSLPFFVRWFVGFDQVEGDKNRAVERLNRAARDGRYLGPFAKILLAIVHLREKRPEQARACLEDFARQYPENPLVRRELARLSSGGAP